MEYEVIDTVTGFSIEPGDMIRLSDGMELYVTDIESVDGGYNVISKDGWDDEVITFIDEDEYVELLG
jgi:hypothetical protein